MPVDTFSRRRHFVTNPWERALQLLVRTLVRLLIGLTAMAGLTYYVPTPNFAAPPTSRW